MASPSLLVIESSRVSPPPGSVPDSSLPFTFFDIAWLYADPVERIFFYQFPDLITSRFIEYDLPNLKSSLSLTLRQFYPLAGKIRRVPESDERHEIHYVDGDSVAFTVVECNGEDFDEHSGSHARDFCMLPRLVPQLPRSTDAQPLLAMQVTLFPKQGVAIGITLHHAACDGSSSMHFMSSWASRCRLGDLAAPLLAPPPIIDRALIPDHRGLYSVFSKVINGILESGVTLPEAPAACSKKVIASFTLDGDQITRLKELVMEKAETGEGHTSALRCSSISVAFAYAWVCLVKTRGYESERSCHFCFVGNCRSGLRPPVPAEYFGNCLGAVPVEEVKAGDLTGDDGFTVAVRAISKSIALFKSDALHGAEEWIQKYMAMLPHQPLSVAGSPQLKVYGIDFGWGKPKKVEVASIIKTGAMSVAESREGVGGLEIGMVLPEHEMDVFATHFNHGFKCLFQ